MPIDLDAAERFVFANARVLDRHRLAAFLHGASVTPVVQSLRAYRNPDGGFGHALEPDVRAPESEPAATLHALEVLAEIGRLDDPMVADAAAWIGRIADADGAASPRQQGPHRRADLGEPVRPARSTAEPAQPGAASGDRPLPGRTLPRVRFLA